MNKTWYLTLAEGVERPRFDRIAGQLGLDFDPHYDGGNTYFYRPNSLDKRAKIGGVEVELYGARSEPYAQRALRIAVRHWNPAEMKRVVVALSGQMPFREIHGDMFDEKAEYNPTTGNHTPFPYTTDVFRVIGL